MAQYDFGRLEAISARSGRLAMPAMETSYPVEAEHARTHYRTMLKTSASRPFMVYGLFCRSFWTAERQV